MDGVRGSEAFVGVGRAHPPATSGSAAVPAAPLLLLILLLLLLLLPFEPTAALEGRA